MSKGSRWLMAAAVGVLASIAFLWWTSIPLGIPGEWTWNRIATSGLSSIELVLGIVQASIAAAAYVGAVWFVAGRLEWAGRRTVGVCLAALVAADFGWLWVIQECPAGVHGMQKTPLVLYSPAASGYFFHARFQIDDTAEFLRGYEAWVSQGDVLHFGTHPPGLFLWHHALNRLCDASPRLTSWLLSTQPNSVRESLDLIAQFPMGAPRPLGDSGRASLWLAALLTQLAASLTVVPLYLVLRRTCSRPTSWMAASLWPLVPALAIFLPRSDALYPLAGMIFLHCWLKAIERRSAVWGAMAGFVLTAGLFFSLALLPVVALAAILAFVPALADVDGRASIPEQGKAAAVLTVLKARIAPVAGLLLAILVVLAALWLMAGLDLPAVWFQNLKNHAGFYSQFPRTGWKWLLVNPVELVFSVGWPIMLLAFASLIRRPDSADTAKSARWWTSLSLATVWAMLWISSKNAGEAARLWLVVMPWFVWMAGLQMERLRRDADLTQNPIGRHLDLFLPSVQAIVCIATVLRVTGFHFGG